MAEQLDAVHLALDTAPAVVSAPSPPDGAAQVFRGTQRFVAGDGARARRPQRLGILAGRDDCSGTARGDCLVAFPGVVGAARGHRGDLFVCRDLVEKVGQDWRVADVASGDLDGPDLQRFLADADVYLAPDTALGATVLTGIPLTFALSLDTGAVDQQVQRSRAATVGDIHVQRPLAATERADVRHSPV